MKKAYRKAACLLLCICLFSFSACLRQGMPRKLSAKAQEEKIQIGVTFDSFIIERWQRDRDVFVAAAQELGAHDPKRVVNLSLPDAPVITGNSKEVFDYYGLNGEGIAKEGRKALKA